MTRRLSGIVVLLLAAAAACAAVTHRAREESPHQIARRISLLDVPDDTKVLVYDSEYSEMDAHGRTRVELGLAEAQVAQLVEAARQKGYARLPVPDTLKLAWGPEFPRAGWFRVCPRVTAAQCVAVIDTKSRQLWVESWLY